MNRKGFTLTETLLLILVIAALGGTGWFAWTAKDSANKSYKNADSANSSTLEYMPKDTTANWVSYSNAQGNFSLKHPESWVRASNLELCNPGLFLVGANEQSVGKCATESFGQMSVSSVEGDKSKQSELDEGYTKIVKTSAKAINITGVMMSGEAIGQEENELGIGGGLPAGTKVTTYIFYANGRTYTATYIQLDSYPNALSDFNLMVTKTLKFSS